MKYLFSILLIIIYVSNSNAADKKYDCDEIAKLNNIEWSVEEDGEWFLDEKVYVKNKTNFKQISFKKIWMHGYPLFGLQISFKDNFHNLCFDSRTFPYGILIEQNKNDLVFYVIANTGITRVYNISFNLKNFNEKPRLSFLSQTKIDNHYNWFVDKLTLKDAIQFHKSLDYEEWIKLYWRGKWYNVEWYTSDYN